jgi:hypothetical protein
MPKSVHVRKGGVRLTSRGLRLTRPSARIGGRVGVNISSRGVHATIRRGRRRNKGCLAVLALPILLAIVAFQFLLFRSLSLTIERGFS